MGRRPPEEIIQTNNRLILVRNEEIKKAPDDIKASKMDTNGMLSKALPDNISSSATSTKQESGSQNLQGITSRA